MHREGLKVYDNNYNNNNLQALFNSAPKVIIDTLTEIYSGLVTVLQSQIYLGLII